MPRAKKIELPPTPPLPTAPPKTWLQEQLADKGLWHSIVGAFIGGFMAIFAGLAVYTFQTMNQHSQELKIKTEQKRILLEGFKNSLEENINIMTGIVDPKSPSIIINNLNLNYFQSTSQIKYETLGNVQLAKKIDDLNFRFNSLEQAIKNFQNIYYNPLTSVEKNFLKTRGRELRTGIILNTRHTLEIAISVLNDVDDQLTTLNKS
jgi:hypothetical protein